MKPEATQNVPLTQWEDGTIRIVGTRVPLDVIVKHFKLGATAEQIHDSFPAASGTRLEGYMLRLLIDENFHQRILPLSV